MNHDERERERERWVHQVLSHLRGRVVKVASTFQERLQSKLEHSTIADRAQPPDTWMLVRDSLAQMLDIAEHALCLTVVGYHGRAGGGSLPTPPKPPSMSTRNNPLEARTH